MASLVNYSSSDSDVEETIDRTFSHQTRTNYTNLPSASELLGKSKLKESTEIFQDNSSLHDGRIRSFQHVRGNWATYVYIPVALGSFEDIQMCCLNYFKLNNLGYLKLIDQLHISLSKTVVLQYHLIESFVKALKSRIICLDSFHIETNELMAYTNSERTRTFVALEIGKSHTEKMIRTLEMVNDVMGNFRLPTFYEDPSFHVSFLWCLGNKVDIINYHLSKMKNDVKKYMTICINVRSICCKSGFKEFIFKLK